MEWKYILLHCTALHCSGCSRGSHDVVLDGVELGLAAMNGPACGQRDCCVRQHCLVGLEGQQANESLQHGANRQEAANGETRRLLRVELDQRRAKPREMEAGVMRLPGEIVQLH